MPTLDDVAHVWGGDLQLSPTGDLGRVNGVERSKQHVLRRLMTNTTGYLQHPDYGAGVGGQVGTILNVAALTALIRGQMLLEASVSQKPEPKVALVQIPAGVQCSVNYIALPDKQPVLLTFNAAP